MAPGGRKRKGSKKKNKKGEEETLDSNNQQLHGNNNNSSTHSHGSVDDSKIVEERDSDSGELEREEEEEIVDQRVVDVVKDEGFEEEVVQVAVEEKTIENGSESADFSAVSLVEEENPVVVPEIFDVVDKEVAVVEEDDEKPVIPEFGEFQPENDISSDIVEEAVIDYVEQDPVVEFKSVEAQVIDDEEPVKEVHELAPQEVVSDAAESLLIPVPPDVVDSELAKNVDSSLSQISDVKDEFSSATEVQKYEQIENPAKVVSIGDESPYALAVNNTSGVVDNGKDLEIDNGVAPVDNITSRAVDNGKELEIKKASEDQPLISTNPLPVRRTSWTGCCGLFEVFSGGNR